jgi:hypothetical protein
MGEDERKAPKFTISDGDPQRNPCRNLSVISLELLRMRFWKVDPRCSSPSGVLFAAQQAFGKVHWGIELLVSEWSPFCGIFQVLQPPPELLAQLAKFDDSLTT